LRLPFPLARQAASCSPLFLIEKSLSETVYLWLCVCMYECMYVCVCMCAYTHPPTHPPTHTHTYRYGTCGGAYIFTYTLSVYTYRYGTWAEGNVYTYSSVRGWRVEAAQRMQRLPPVQSLSQFCFFKKKQKSFSKNPYPYVLCTYRYGTWAERQRRHKRRHKVCRDSRDCPLSSPSHNATPPRQTCCGT
jgi:hypothetical protein